LLGEAYMPHRRIPKPYMISNPDFSASEYLVTLPLREKFNSSDSPADVAVLRWGYKRSREFARRLGIYRGEYIPGHPAFQEGSTASGKDAASGPVPVDAPDIVYSVEDDAAINEYVRNFGEHRV
jgi:hypothetical protein